MPNENVGETSNFGFTKESQELQSRLKALSVSNNKVRNLSLQVYLNSPRSIQSLFNFIKSRISLVFINSNFEVFLSV